MEKFCNYANNTQHTMNVSAKPSLYGRRCHGCAVTDVGILPTPHIRRLRRHLLPPEGGEGFGAGIPVNCQLSIA